MIDIPTNAFLYKEGLYINEYEKNVGKLKWTVWELYSADGYCFYDLQIPENYDEENNLLPAEQLTYYTYSIMKKDEEYVINNIVPVVRQNNFEIV